MSLKEELIQEMEITRQDFHHLLDSVPEALYHHPSDNPAWTIGYIKIHFDSHAEQICQTVKEYNEQTSAD